MSLLHLKTHAHAWAGRGISTICVRVEGAVVYVWDDIANHYTRRHDLSPRAEKRIRAAYAAQNATHITPKEQPMTIATHSVRKTLTLVRRDLRAADGQASYGIGWLSQAAREALAVLGLEVRHAAGAGGALLGIYLVVGSNPATAGRRPIAV